jgi:hypothetical protein
VRLPNQRLGPLSLLDLGVRELEVDIWDTILPGSAANDFEVYVCHSPVPDPYAVLELQAAATALGMGQLSYDPFRELCSNHTFAWALAQVASWLASPGHEQEVVALFLDNRVAPWNIDLVSSAISAAFGASLMTPGDVQVLFAGSFPSRNAMLAQGRRVYVESNSYLDNNYTGTSLSKVAFYPTTWQALQLGAEGLAPFPNCTIAGHEGTAWYGKKFVRVLDGGDLAMSPSEEAESGIIFKPNGVADLTACGFNNIALADVSPAAVAGGMVWSWAQGEPAALNGSSCRGAAMALVRGSWAARDCSEALPVLCRRGDNRQPGGASPELWSISAEPVPLAGAAAACSALGPAWAFDTPRDGRENALVAQRLLLQGFWAAGGRGLWLNVPGL